MCHDLAKRASVVPLPSKCLRAILVRVDNKLSHEVASKRSCQHGKSGQHCNGTSGPRFYSLRRQATALEDELRRFVTAEWWWEEASQAWEVDWACADDINCNATIRS